MSEKQRYTVVLAGNPNTGKTSLFNQLTDSYAYVGNWPGVTVEKKTGHLTNQQGILIDLPGVYSLNPLSADEKIVSHFLINDDFSLLLNIVDGSQLARNLYLTVQLLELEKPLLLAINMVDVLENQGSQINTRVLQENLGIPVVPVVARTGLGLDDLKKQMLIFGESHDRTAPFRLDYQLLERDIDRISEKLPDGVPVSKRWLSLQFLEGNKAVEEYLASLLDIKILQAIRNHAAQTIGEDVEQYIRRIRRTFIDSVVSRSLRKTSTGNISMFQRIDHIVMHPYLSMPFFFVVMYFIFKLTFDWIGGPLSDLLDSSVFVPLSLGLQKLFNSIGIAPFIQDLILEGIIPGVGGVLVFVPQIFSLFFFITLIEDSGYMARIAVIMDRLLEKVGLNGKSIIPMIIGFGCNVPAVMAARTIENPRERLITILVTPLMSCSARLPIYTLFAGAFFTNHQATVVFSLYLLGILAALILAKTFSKTLYQGEPSVFVVELPPYRIPHVKTLVRSTWEKGKGFVHKAGTFIFAGSVVIWLLSYSGPQGLGLNIEDSFLAMIGKLFALLFAPLGFGTWESAASLMTGFLAKEVVVSTMNIIYATADVQSLKGLITQNFTPLQAYSFMVFTLFYVPCIATVAVIKNETGSGRWMWFSILYSVILAYTLSLIVYQGGRLLGFN